MTLYAKWEGKYLVTFNTCGGSEIDAVKTGTSLQAPAEPTREGYNFVGWYSDVNYNTEYDFNQAVSSGMTLYAKWEGKYLVTFDTRGGSEIGSVRVGGNAKLSQPANPTKERHKFLGWYTDAEYSQAYNFEQPVNSNLTLYAKWESADGKYIITFDTCGGELLEDQYVVANNKMTTVTPVWGDYEFQGWYLDAEYTQQFYGDSLVTDDITLYAKWSVNVEELYTFNLWDDNSYEIYSYKQKSNTDITTLVLPRTYKNLPVTIINSEAFNNCTNLTMITIPGSVTMIGHGGLYTGLGAFYGCSSLTTITIPDGVTSIGRSAFSSCSSLTTIYLESDSIPSDWNSEWNNCCEARVLLYGIDWEYVDGVPTEIQK